MNIFSYIYIYDRKIVEADQRFERGKRPSVPSSISFAPFSFTSISRYPPSLSFVHPRRAKWGISRFLASLAGAQDENKATRRNGEKEEWKEPATRKNRKHQPPFLLFFLSSSAKQQGADIPRWFYRIGSTNKLRIAVAIIGYTCEAIDRGFFSKEVEMTFFRHSYCSYLLLLFIELYNVRFLSSLFITSGEIL